MTDTKVEPIDDAIAIRTFYSSLDGRVYGTVDGNHWILTKQQRIVHGRVVPVYQKVEPPTPEQNARFNVPEFYSSYAPDKEEAKPQPHLSLPDRIRAWLWRVAGWRGA